MAPSMDTTNRPLNLGQSLDDQAVRLDAVAKVTGRAQFSRDKYLPNSGNIGTMMTEPRPWVINRL